MSRRRSRPLRHLPVPSDHAVPTVPTEPAVPWVARSQLDLVALVPQVLGFHPADSVVVMCFGGPRSFHARTDLPEVEQGRAEVAAMLARACLANAATSVAVLLYTGDHALALDQGERVVHELHAGGVEVLDVLRVHDDRWYSVLREDPDGTAFDLSVHPFTARAVFEGRAVHRDRDALRATLSGGEERERHRLALAADLRERALVADADPQALSHEARWLRQRVREAVATGAPVGAGDVARILVAVVRGDVRDAAWVDLRRSTAAQHVALWLDLVRRAPQPLLPAVCGLLALAAYLDGNGALAWCAIDRAREVQPRHSLVDLVAEMLEAAVPPSAWPVPSVDALPILREGGAQH